MRPCRACGGHAWSPDDPSGCLACDGTGQIEERIPATDAIADAETLGDAVAVLSDGRSQIRAISRLWRFAARIEDGAFASPADAAQLAQLAHRAALRAVPGLGE